MDFRAEAMDYRLSACLIILVVNSKMNLVNLVFLTNSDNISELKVTISE